ncbi:MAG: DUF4827 domain-containing protein [Bacteroidaceae bacterium]|nr:DUF4827 domain-containing protein [Bacteroidaceae bacterium]
MKAKTFIIAALACAIGLTACKDEETYAEQKEREIKAINSFLGSDTYIISNDGLDTVLHVGVINPISEETFEAQDSTTDVSRNEYVLFTKSGIYMQIVREGVGERLESGNTARVIARYIEYNILSDSIQSRNDIFYWHTNPDIMEISNRYGTYSATFSTDNGGGAMYQTYNSTSVPTGWLKPFPYIRIGRQIEEDDRIAKVRLIVPHSEGTQKASSGVYPCFYEITFQRMRD